MRTLKTAVEHVSKEDIELYSLGRLTEPAISRVETHLLVCERCRSRVTEEDAYIQGMRSALRDVPNEPRGRRKC
jgi:anti-sigma factor RsiW